MASSRWKEIERQLARLLGGVRTNRDRGERVEDITHPVLSIEVKHGKQIPVFVQNAVGQAEINSPSGKIPVSIFHPYGWKVGDSVVCMSLDSLTKLLQLVSVPIQAQENQQPQQSGVD